MDEVKKCCGEVPRYFTIENSYGIKFHRLICLRCGMRFTAPSKEKVIERWNRRVEDVQN